MDRRNQGGIRRRALTLPLKWTACLLAMGACSSPGLNGFDPRNQAYIDPQLQLERDDYRRMTAPKLAAEKPAGEIEQAEPA